MVSQKNSLMKPSNNLSKTHLRENSRNTERWATNQLFIPIGTTQLPQSLNEKIYFRIGELLDKGLTLLTSLRNSHLLKVGLVCDLEVSFPTIGFQTINIEVVNLREKKTQDHSQLILGVKILSSGKAFKKFMAQYLVQVFPQCDPSSAKKGKSTS